MLNSIYLIMLPKLSIYLWVVYDLYRYFERWGNFLDLIFDLTGRLALYTSLPVIASGGIRHQEDLFRLESLNVHAAIVGKAAHLDEFWEGLS